MGAGGLSPTASLSLGNGNNQSSDVTNIETIVTAGGTATVTTPGALTLQGALLDAQTVKVDVGALTIRSEQDKIDF